MLTMHRKNFIRELYYVNGKNITEISRDSGHDRKTVRKVIGQDDWNKPELSAEQKSITPKLEPFKAIIDEWLLDDKRSKRKQRHTSTRVFKRLSTEKETRKTFNCSYETVNTYVKKKKAEIFGEQLEGSIPLEHKPGESQADFGVADYYENGTLIEGHYFNISFPYSNKGYPQLYPGENTECLFEGLVNIFKHIDGVPPEIWFDNAGTMVTNVLKGEDRKLTERFIRFKEHYGFTAIFCNLDAGNEKGSVEGKVGYHRRNMLVPVPRFQSLEEYNEYLLELADSDADRVHYRKEILIEELFEADKSALLPLPRNEFDTAGYMSARTDKYGFIKLEDGKHEYSTAPKYAASTVIVKLTATTVSILDESRETIVTHKRLYGDKKGRQMNWIPYLEQLARRPRAVKYCGIYNILPPVVNDYLSKSKGNEISAIIRMIADLTKKTDFESATATVAQAIKHDAIDADSLMALHRRLFADVPELPPLKHPDLPELNPMSPDLSKYDLPIGRRNVDERA